MGRLPARCSSRSCTAPSPQAMVSASVQHGAGRPGAVRQRRAQHPDALATRRSAGGHLEPGAGDRRQPAHVVVHLLRRAREVDRRFALVDLGGIGHAGGRLRHASQPAVLDLGQRAHHQACTALRKHIVELAGGHVRPDRHALLEADRPGVEALVHPHHRRRRLGVAGHDGALDRRRAAPAGQGRRVQVQAAFARRVENRLRQDEAIGNDHGDIGVQAGEGVLLRHRS